jgi:KTSC domain
MKNITGSSNIEAFGHEGNTLSVRFRGGAVYDFHDFPAHLHDKWLEAYKNGESVGQFFHRNIKPHFEGKKREAQ